MNRLVDLLVVPSIDDEPTSEETTAANGRSEEAAENEEENKNEKDEHSTEESVSEENLFKGVETVPPESFLAMWSAFMRLIHLRIERAKHLEQCIHRLLALPSLLGKTEPADGKETCIISQNAPNRNLHFRLSIYPPICQKTSVVSCWNVFFGVCVCF